MKNSAHLQERLLEKVRLLVEADERFVGMWAVGSMAIGKADRYSDLDLYLLAEGDNYDEVYAERSSFAERIGKVLSTFEVEWPNCQLHGVISDSCVEVDLCYCKPDQLEIFGPYKIIVDRKGNLQELLSKHTVSFESDMKKNLKEQMDLAAYNLLHAINMLGRGEYWSSIRQVEMLRKRAISLIGLRTKTDVAEEYRKLESIINREGNRDLQQTLCDYSPENIGKAVRAAAIFFIQEAKSLCIDEGVSFPSGRFDRLLEYLDGVLLEKGHKSVS